MQMMTIVIAVMTRQRAKNIVTTFAQLSLMVGPTLILCNFGQLGNE